MSEIADYMFPPLKDSSLKASSADGSCEDQEEEEVRARKRLQYTLHVDDEDDWTMRTALCCSACVDGDTEIVKDPSLS